jgi:hypothetical protein
MTPDDAAAVVTPGTPASTAWSSRDGVTTQTFTTAGLTLYYAPNESRLHAVRVNAFRGPQILADGFLLVGQVPSKVENWVEERAVQRPNERELCYVPGGEVSSFGLGMVICVQRHGDHLLTAPVFLLARNDEELANQFSSEVWVIR